MLASREAPFADTWGKHSSLEPVLWKQLGPMFMLNTMPAASKHTWLLPCLSLAGKDIVIGTVSLHGYISAWVTQQIQPALPPDVGTADVVAALWMCFREFFLCDSHFSSWLLV